MSLVIYHKHLHISCNLLIETRTFNSFPRLIAITVSVSKLIAEKSNIFEDFADLHLCSTPTWLNLIIFQVYRGLLCHKFLRDLVLPSSKLHYLQLYLPSLTLPSKQELLFSYFTMERPITTPSLQVLWVLVGLQIPDYLFILSVASHGTIQCIYILN